MPSGIYGIIHIGSEKVYVGSALNIKKRWREHRHYLRLNKHINQYLQNAWNKHGEDLFKFVILEEVKKSHLLIEREQYWLDGIRSYERKNGYNIAAIAGSQLGYKHTIATKEKLSKIHSGRNLTPEHSKAISSALKGRVHSDKAKSLLSESHAKLSKRQTFKLLNDFYFKGDHIKEIAKKYNLSQTSIWRITEGKVYKDRLTEWFNDNNLKQYPLVTHGHSKILKTDVFDIYDMKLAGERHSAIAKKHGLSISSITAIVTGINHPELRTEYIKKRGLDKSDIKILEKRSGVRMTDEAKDMIKRQICSGVKQVDIAKEFGVSPQTICDVNKGRL